MAYSYSIENKGRQKMNLNKITWKSTSKKNENWIYSGSSITPETAEEFIARRDSMDVFNRHEIIECRPATEEETKSFLCEESASGFYAKHGTAGEL